MTTSLRMNFYVSNQGKLYKNMQYVTLINKRLFNVAPKKYGKLVCVYDSSQQSGPWSFPIEYILSFHVINYIGNCTFNGLLLILKNISSYAHTVYKL